MRETHRNNLWKSGDYWRECDVCSFDYLRSELRERYDGAIVCSADWEEEHPRDQKRSKVKEAPFKGDTNSPTEQAMDTSAMIYPARSV